MLVVIRDVTARRQAENAVRESETRFRQLAEASFDAILVIEDGVITDANGAATQLYGYDASQMIGRSVLDLVTPVHHDIIGRRIARSEEGYFDVDHVRRDGSVFPVEVSAKHVELAGRNVRVLAIRNVTERRRAEDALRAAKEAAELASRAKTEFLANMSHELRTPLNAVIGFSEVMATEVHGSLGNRRYVEYAEDIHVSGRHLLDVINDILDVSKIESGTMELFDEAVDLRAVVKSSALLVSGRANDRRVYIEVEEPRHSALIRADKRKLKQILINLLSNAVKFTPHGGRVCIAWRSDPREGVYISVSDTGIGIAAEDIEVVLTPFRQVDGSLGRIHEGTGLGLPLAKSFAELHGGTLEIDSDVGRGTTVTIRFPERRIIQKIEGLGSAAAG